MRNLNMDTTIDKLFTQLLMSASGFLLENMRYFLGVKTNFERQNPDTFPLS